MSIVISSVGTKGGTGKTSLAKFFSIVKAKENKKVLIIDLCQNSDIATRLGYNRGDFEWDTYDWVSGKVSFELAKQHDEETDVDFIPSSNLVEKIQEYAERKRRSNPNVILKEKIDQIKDKYDYVILDNHPTETNKIMIMSLLASDLALVPTILDMSSVIATIRTIEIIRDLQEEGVHIPFGVVPMNVDFSRGFRKQLDDVITGFTEMGIKNITSAIRYSTVVMKAGLENEVVRHNNSYMQNVMDDYRVVAKEIDEMVLLTQERGN